MSSNAIRPTWAPFSSALSAEERLVFSLRLMNGRWEAIPTSRWAFSTLCPVPRNPAPHGEANPAQPMANSSAPAFGLSLGAGRMGQLEPCPLPHSFAEDWSAERPFTGFQLGDVLNIQAEVGTESHVPLRLFVDSCVAALSPSTDSSPHYTIIDFNG